MTISESELIARVIEWTRAHQPSGSSAETEINEDTDLIATGLLDSFGFVDLIVHIESLDGCKVDLTDVDPAEFAVVKGLCRIALRNHG